MFKNKHYDNMIMNLNQTIADLQARQIKTDSMMITMVRYIDNMENRITGEHRAMLELEIKRMWNG